MWHTLGLCGVHHPVCKLGMRWADAGKLRQESGLTEMDSAKADVGEAKVCSKVLPAGCHRVQGLQIAFIEFQLLEYPTLNQTSNLHGTWHSTLQIATLCGRHTVLQLRLNGSAWQWPRIL